MNDRVKKGEYYSLSLCEGQSEEGSVLLRRVSTTHSHCVNDRVKKGQYYSLSLCEGQSEEGSVLLTLIVQVPGLQFGDQFLCAAVLPHLHSHKSSHVTFFFYIVETEKLHIDNSLSENSNA